jgi:TetR/AcrR family transcriptional repressor of nem operon
VVRHKEFEPDEALDSAMNLFWEKGYEATSVQDLVDRTGVGRRSLYDTFGDKHSLYMMSLRRYIDWQEGNVREAAVGSADGLTGVRALFMVLLLAGDPSRGCMVVNSATEVGPTDGEAAEALGRHLTLTRELLSDLVSRGKQDGSIVNAGSVEVLTSVVFNAWLGFRVGARGGITKDRRVKDFEDIVSMLTTA